MAEDISRLIGIAPFDYTIYESGGGYEWEAWLRSFEWYLKANKIEDDLDKFVKLMHMAGQKVQELFAILPVPEHVNSEPRGPLVGKLNPHLTEYEMAIAKLNDHFQPKKNTTYERYELRQIKQESDEKIATFLMRLRKQADRCDFGEKFDDNVKDQLIEKCSSPLLRRKLLAKGDAGLDVIIQEAKAFEAVQEQGKVLDDKNLDQLKTSDVHKIEMRRKQSVMNGKNATVVCHRCGFSGHRQFDENCPAKGKTCNKCGGSDHFSRKCRTKNTQKRPRRVIEKLEPASREMDEKPILKVEEETTPKRKKEEIKFVSTIDDKEYIFCIQNTGVRAKNEMGCKIGGVELTVVIDSGSKYNIIDGRAWEFLKKNNVRVSNQRTSTDINFNAFGENPLTFVGVFESKVETAKRFMLADFYVFKDYGRILIGYDTAISLGILKLGESVNQIEVTERASKFKGIMVNIPINRDVTPIVQPYRRIPVPLEDAANTKVDEFLSRGIIEKVDGPSPWVSPLVVVPKKDGVRVCVDMRRANEAVERENHPLPTIDDFLPHMGEAKWFTKLDVKDAYHQVN